jgi:hypothetical protein
MAFNRNHQHLVICNDCEWYRYCGRAPYAAARYAKRHSANALGHKSSVIDLQSLESVTAYLLDAIPPVKDDPPF